MKVQAAVFHWDRQVADTYKAYLLDQTSLSGPNIFVVTGIDHEAHLLNVAISCCTEAEYLWFVTPDVRLPFAGVIESLAEVMDSNSQIGVVLPNRQNDPGVGGHSPYKKYLADGTAMLYRCKCTREHNVWFDPEFIFTGWNDLDFGKDVEYAGYEIWVDPRTAVHKQETAYGSWSSFRRAYNARNRLLLEAKWYWDDRENWRGVEAYNASCVPNRRIPTQFELAWWSEERLNAFADSVEMEHPQILMKDGQGSGNENWRFL